MLNKGFTLIELLVVVLIIAILTVIAVPIFNIAVEKSRAADAITNIKSISSPSRSSETTIPSAGTSCCSRQRPSCV